MARTRSAMTRSSDTRDERFRSSVRLSDTPARTGRSGLKRRRPGTSGGEGRGAAGRPDGEENAVCAELVDDRSTRIRQGPRADDDEAMGIRTDDAGRAGRAMLRRLELALQIVVLEWRRQDEDGIECQPNAHETVPAPITHSAEHQLMIRSSSGVPQPIHARDAICASVCRPAHELNAHDLSKLRRRDRRQSAHLLSLRNGDHRGEVQAGCCSTAIPRQSRRDDRRACGARCARGVLLSERRSTPVSLGEMGRCRDRRRRDCAARLRPTTLGPRACPPKMG
jgi:hypothetical protein